MSPGWESQAFSQAPTGGALSTIWTAPYTGRIVGVDFSLTLTTAVTDGASLFLSRNPNTFVSEGVLAYCALAVASLTAVGTFATSAVKHVPLNAKFVAGQLFYINCSAGVGTASCFTVIQFVRDSVKVPF